MKKIAGLALLSLFVSCNQGLNVGEKEAASVERKAGDAQYDDGDYTFYFNTGAIASGDCDGYSIENGRVKIYEYFSPAIRKWNKRLEVAGVQDLKMDDTSVPFIYCSVSFPQEYLLGVGSTKRDGRGTLRLKGGGNQILLDCAGANYFFINDGELVIYYDGKGKNINSDYMRMREVPKKIETYLGLTVKSVNDTEKTSEPSIVVTGEGMAFNFGF